MRIQALADALTAIGDHVSEKEHPDVILEGLPEEFESTISVVSNKFEPLSIDEVATLLLSHEARLDKFRKKAIASANVAVSVMNSASSSKDQPQPQANIAEQQ